MKELYKNPHLGDQDKYQVSPERPRWTVVRVGLVCLLFLVFGLLAEPLLWDPVRVAYYDWLLQTEDRDTAIQYFNRLHELGPAGRDRMISLLDDPLPQKRKWAVTYLYHYQPPGTEEKLLKSLQDPVKAVRVEAESFLWGIWQKSEDPAADRLFRRGITHAMSGRWDKAIQWFEQAHKVDPDFIEYYNQMGNAWEQAGQVERAIQSYRKMVELKPEHFGALERLAQLSFLLGDEEAAWYYAGKLESVFPYRAMESGLVPGRLVADLKAGSAGDRSS
jgi:tetratricopeptide (TPR) repeat protein